MLPSDVMETIQTSLDEILKAKGMEPVKITPETKLLDGSVPIDSLDLAQLVLELQAATGSDPFADGFVNFESASELSSLFSR